MQMQWRALPVEFLLVIQTWKHRRPASRKHWHPYHLIEFLSQLWNSDPQEVSCLIIFPLIRSHWLEPGAALCQTPNWWTHQKRLLLPRQIIPASLREPMDHWGEHNYAAIWQPSLAYRDGVSRNSAFSPPGTIVHWAQVLVPKPPDAFALPILSSGVQIFRPEVGSLRPLGWIWPATQNHRARVEFSLGGKAFCPICCMLTPDLD